MSQFQSLRNHFLIAMPHLEDTHFSGTVTYICEHNKEGALGIVINKTLAQLPVSELFAQLELPNPNSGLSESEEIVPAIFEGGPVHHERGFIIHTGGSEKWESSMQVSDELALTTSVDILDAIANLQGPKQFLIALGCAGWEGGQLERELQENAWLTCPATLPVLFEAEPEQKLQAAAGLLGVDINLISSQAGHA
ncbi:YqgE/AlgH family protein [Oceanospirillum maris]|jgi:putative transcriptional regulator|uniref:YqgE/AlgH family protein n=1 Tax=Oceanospirillum maris TaxID=64977 RepID=UPI000407545E|nr:YqgE/AlgH family protein [Oceanospirillum maris]